MDDKPTKDQKLKHARHNAANVRVKELETFLFQTFIAASEHFNHQISYLLDMIQTEDMSSWTLTTYKQLFTFLEHLFQDENCILRSVMKFSLMLVNINPDVTWLDEITEALKNTATSLNDYIIFSQNLPIKIKK